ncbi:YebC/PmpR family DNA-binding transcriptional regulator [Aerococcus sanguinicola]|uniref:Probable transcriptional regulatory protein AWM72_07805 n=1 Tax=Aerococcus sanguinicola TaxID=119206 RepID=A0A0X8FCD2_9LACT|nr:MULTISPECIES: YebC/PmpR family DNA-binding transcriptional regulator [Aerococcus]AMB94665.1 transcriptional regulator [Aerococcus sanguinicola]MDK6232789.1 YebC/PmpR family DNA-binding transcriptional regulator [Aerococcus sp. UMB10185]MDK6805262.1 YebC/PmpR family DNA-binding transcriptional regulator [Aerococcus sp. UMB7834]MDK6854921.1 YebC/PmpR family DNA-binding transcriptional regulator [Aerococcus sp. UMB7533]MDK7050875.1 YebC/PmpR family DNA-binding transcriptional regulator [Aeroco
MSGHNKWSKIKNTKGAEDAKRAKVFQKLSREIYMAVKQGGPEPNSNPALRMVMDKAKSANMPKSNIERAIDKGSNQNSGEDYDEVTYEGYGPNGIAVYVETLTDNTNRTLSNVRTIFNKNGGSLGESGSVAFMFDRKGYIAIEREGLDVDEDTMLMEALEAGAEDLQVSDEVFEIYSQAEDFGDVRDALKEDGYELASAELTMVPKTLIDLPADKAETFENLIDKLEDDDDVQNVYYTTELPED